MSEFTKLTLPRQEFIDTLDERIRKGNVILNKLVNGEKDYFSIKNKFEDWDDFNLEVLKNSFNFPQNEYRKPYESIGQIWFRDNDSTYSEEDELILELQEKIRYLKSLIQKVPIMKTERPIHQSNIDKMGGEMNEVFIVHGHDNHYKEAVARLLEKSGLTPVILHEMTNQGATIIEKFEKYSNVRYAIALFTSDDIGTSKLTPNDLQPRARQNVIFELGYFMGKLSRQNCLILYEKGVEKPTDIHGFLYIELDTAGAWKSEVYKELKAAGFSIDLNNL